MTYRPMPQFLEEPLQQLKQLPHGARVPVEGPLMGEVLQYLRERAHRQDLVLDVKEKPDDPNAFYIGCEPGYVIRRLESQFGYERSLLVPRPLNDD